MIGKFAKISAYAIGTLCIALILIVFGLPGLGWKALSVQTGSMRPAINPGALLLVHRVPDPQLHIGDVITYDSMINKGERITHRIVGFKQVGPVRDIVAKGDANKITDPPLMPTQIVGKVTIHVGFVGHVIDFVHSIPGLVVLVYLPAFLIVIFEITALIRRLTEIALEERRHEASVLRFDPARPHIVSAVAPMSVSSRLASRPRPVSPKMTRLAHHARSIDGMRI